VGKWYNYKCENISGGNSGFFFEVLKVFCPTAFDFSGPQRRMLGRTTKMKSIVLMLSSI